MIIPRAKMEIKFPYKLDMIYEILVSILMILGKEIF